MAINNIFGYDQNTSDRGLSILQTALGMGPASFGVYAAARGFSQSNPGLAAPLKSGQALRGLGRSLGASAKRRGGQEAQRAQGVREAFRKAAQGGAAFDRLKNRLEGYNGVIQMLSTALEDPAFGVEATRVRMLKEELVQSIDGLDQENIEDLLRSTINTLVDSDVDNQALLRLERYQDEFAGVGSQIQVPDFDINNSGKAYNPISVGALRRGEASGLSSRALKRAESIMDRFGKSHHVEFHTGSEFGHTRGLSAQVYSSNRKIHLANIPLQVETSPEGMRVFRTGRSFNTAYAAPAGAVNVRTLDRVFGDSGVKGVRSAMSAGKGIVGFEDMVMELVRNHFKTGNFQYRDFNTALTSVAPIVSRMAAARGSSFGRQSRHVRTQAAHSTNYLSAFGMQGIEQERLMRVLSAAASAPGYDPGRASSMLSGFGSERVAKIGLEANSPISHIQSTYGLGRTDIPVTARIEQLVGRQDSFYNPSGRVRRAGGSIVGAIGRGQNIMGDLVTGGYNQFMVMDFTGMKGVAGEGYGFTGSNRYVNRVMDMVVLDPKAHGLGASKLLKHISDAGDEGLHLSRSELGQYLGQTPAGKAKFLNLPPNTLGATVAIDRVAEAAGKRQVHLAVNAQLESGIGKYFSMLFKGNLRNVGTARMQSLYRGGIEQDVGNYLDDVGQAAFVSADMAKKGRGILAYQIGRSAELISNAQTQNARNQLARDLGQAANAMTNQDIKQALGLSAVPNARTAHQYKFAVAAFHKLKGKASGRDLGMMLAGAYNQEYKGSPDLAEVQRGLRHMMRAQLGEEDAKAAITSMKRGMAMFVETMQRGPTVADEYGKGRPGMEARTAQNIYETLLGQGMDKDDASRVVGSIYGDKIGFRKHFELAGHLSRMTASITGTEGPFGSTPGKLMSYTDMQARTIAEPMSEILRGQAGGLRLDLSGADSTLRSVVKEVFGQTDIHLPGQEMMAIARGTGIKQSAGQSLAIESEYGQLVNSLSSRLTGAGGQTRAEISASLREWKDNALKLFAGVHTSLARGKLRGSTTGTAALYDLTYGHGLKQNEFDALKKLYVRTQGQFAGINAEGFISALADRQGMDTADELSWKARTFFTGMESGTSQFKGVMTLGGRDPMMSGSNVFLQQMGRDIHEVSHYGNEDVFFRKMAETDAGKQMLNRFQRNTGIAARHFGDIAGARKSAQIEFFDDFMKNLSSFTGGQGGAVISTPTMHARIGGKTVDIGVSSGAYLDRDGDAVKMIMLKRRDSAALMSLAKDKNLGFRSIVSELGNQIDVGVSNIAGRLGSPPVGVDAVMEDALKEMGLSQLTGKIDVRLRGLHTALLDYSDDPGTTQRGRAMLAALQEKFVLKTKRLPRYTPVATMLGNAVDRLMTSGDIGDLRMVLQDYAFAGTEFAGGQEIGSAGYALAENARNADVLEALNVTRQGFTLEGALNEFQRVANYAVANQTNYGGTAGNWLSRLKNEAGAARAMSDLQAGRDMHSAALREYLGDTVESKISTVGSAISQVRSSIGRMNAKMMAPVGAGLMASVALMGAMGDEGYSPTPMVMPGESVNARVTEAIARGNLFSSQRTVHQQQMQRAVNTPMSGGTTYMQAPNAYQIRGETNQGQALDQLGAFMHRATGGRVGGSIFVNDSRRHITSAYSDRLMGEY